MSRRLITDHVSESQVGLDSPFILQEEEIIVVTEIGDDGGSWKRSVDLRGGGLIVDQPLQIRVLEPAADIRVEELELLLTAEVEAELHRMRAPQYGKRIL